MVVVGMFQMDVKIAGWAAWLAKVPFVFSAQNLSYFYGNAFLKRLKQFFFGFTLRKTCQLAVCASDAVREELAEKYHFEQTRVVPNGIETGLYGDFSAEERREEE